MGECDRAMYYKNNCKFQIFEYVTVKNVTVTCNGQICNGQKKLYVRHSTATFLCVFLMIYKKLEH